MTDERSEAPADVAPELAEDERAEGRPLPGVPDVDETTGAQVPPTSGAPDREPTDAKPIRYRRREASTEDERASAEDERTSTEADDSCGCGSACGCGGSKAGGTDTPADGAAVDAAVADGGTAPANVDGDGNLTDLEFTSPAADVSQNVDAGRPDERVGLPEGVDLDTPGYGIRDEMNDVETPDEKTWFMELDDAVVDADRCIRCGTCVAACPSDSIAVGDDGLPELVKMCTGCSLCWDFCPRGGMRYERQWKITGGDDNVTGAGDPITEFSARVREDWHENAQDGGVVTAVLSTLIEEDEIDGALIATESDDEPWKAESFLATSREELVENAGSFYNQTMALGNLDLSRWEHKLDGPVEEASLALVGTPCEIEGIRALQDFEWEYGSQAAGVRAIDYSIALMCTKNFNYQRLVGEQLAEKRDIPPEEIGKLDVLDGEMRVYDRGLNLVLAEDVEEFHDAALKGCSECADFTGYCADLTVGSVGSSDDYSSVIVRTERGLDAWERVEPALDYHDLENRGAIGGLQSWDKEQAFEALDRPFDPDAPRFIDYTDHAERYGTEVNPHETDH